MKNFTEYLAEGFGSRKHTFRIKVAGDFESAQESKLKAMLERWVVSKFKKIGTTPIQEIPLDFPQLKNCDVKIFEVELDYPATQQELTEYLSQGLSLNKQRFVVKRPGEPTEEYQEPKEQREGALLDDADYSEVENAKFENFYGDKFNSGFVKELNDLLKLERKARGEQIPSEAAAKFNTDQPADTTSMLKSAPDPRR